MSVMINKMLVDYIKAIEKSHDDICNIIIRLHKDAPNSEALSHVRTAREALNNANRLLIVQLYDKGGIQL